MRKYLYLAFCISLLTSKLYAQDKQKRIFFQGSNGIAGTIFGRTYPETLPETVLGYKAYVNMRFLGTAQDYSLGFHVNKKVDLSVGYNRQRFTRWVKAEGRTGGVKFLVRKKIQQVENSIYAGASRKYQNGNNTFSWGGGAGYIISQMQRVEIYPGAYLDEEYNARDLIAFAEMGYAYRFQKKVDIGIKGQVWWILSGSYFNSVSLMPYVRLDL